jgi:hypothetical protein
MLPLVPDHMRGAASVEQDHPVPLGKVVAGDAIQVAAVPCDARPLAVVPRAANLKRAHVDELRLRRRTRVADAAPAQSVRPARGGEQTERDSRPALRWSEREAVRTCAVNDHVLQTAWLCGTSIENDILVANGQMVAADPVDAANLPRQTREALSCSARAELRPDNLERASMHAEILMQ